MVQARMQSLCPLAPLLPAHPTRILMCASLRCCSVSRRRQQTAGTSTRTDRIIKLARWHTRTTGAYELSALCVVVGPAAGPLAGWEFSLYSQNGWARPLRVTVSELMVGAVPGPSASCASKVPALNAPAPWCMRVSWCWAWPCALCSAIKVVVASACRWLV